MFSEKRRYGQDPNVVVRSKPATFNAPLKWKEPSLIFTCSWSDWFIEDADEHRAEMWDVIRRTPQHTYQILTKRADRIKDHLPPDWGEGWPNVWLGVSVENQEQDWRIVELMKTPAALRFLSLEPLLGPIELDGITIGDDEGAGWTYRHWNALTGDNWCDCQDYIQPIGTGPIHWVIVGGESDGQSGTNARECSLDWIHSLTEQCSRADVPFFVKQLGAKPIYPGGENGAMIPFSIRSKKGDDPVDFPCHFLQEMPEIWQQRMERLEQAAQQAEMVR